MLQPPRSGASAYVPKQSDIKCGVDPAVVVTSDLGNTAPTFQVPKVFGADAKLATSFTYVNWRCSNPTSIHAPMVVCVLWQSRKRTHHKSAPGWLPNSSWRMYQNRYGTT